MKNNNVASISGLFREDLDLLKGLVGIEFGAASCAYCQAAEAIITSAFVNYPRIRHIKIEDGKGEILGRSYFITLWPTLIFLKNGTEIKRLVRPNNSETLDAVLDEISKS